MQSVEPRGEAGDTTPSRGVGVAFAPSAGRVRLDARPSRQNLGRHLLRSLISKLTKCRLAAALLCAIALPSFAAPLRGGYRVVSVFPVPGEGHFDYLTADETGRRLYLSHESQVEVLDLDSGKVVGRIPGTQGVHGIAVAPDVGRGFTSNSGTSSVTIFDLKTLKVLGAAASGKDPDAIIYEPTTHRVFCFNGEDRTVTVIQAAGGRVVATIDLQDKPEFAAADGRGGVFVNLGQKSIGRLDARALKLD